MEWNPPDYNSWPTKLVLRMSKGIRSKRAFTQDAIDKDKAKEAEKTKRHAQQQARKPEDSHQEGVNELGERDCSIFSETSTLVNHHADHTEMMHGLMHHDSFDSLIDKPSNLHKLRDPYFDSTKDDLKEPVCQDHERRVSGLTRELWRRIAGFLGPADAARLTLSSKTLHEKLGSEPWDILNLPENKHHKADFLHHMDGRLSGHLFCFPCATYHVRTQRGREVYKMDYVSNPLFICPNAKNSVLPRTRITHGRELPYAFVQLATRAVEHSPHHGIDFELLNRGYKCRASTWSHKTRYVMHNGHLLVRVVSQAFAAPKLTETALRHLLYDREEYTPFFSVCAHWRDGELMRLCKCALSHVPAPPDLILQQLKRTPKISFKAARPCFIVVGCDECHPMRRCPQCPTEYLIEVRMVEDQNDSVHRFKHAIVVTRWSDLGDGSSPVRSPEWAAIQAERGEAYDSFSHVGRRAVSGIFESMCSGTIPCQRMLSLNPSSKKKGEGGHGWY